MAFGVSLRKNEILGSHVLKNYVNKDSEHFFTLGLIKQGMTASNTSIKPHDPQPAPNSRIVTQSLFLLSHEKHALDDGTILVFGLQSQQEQEQPQPQQQQSQWFHNLNYNF